ncbi:MAG: gluconate 2-dehydrogenase subunit 3 family protein [Vicinamibacterales bacterium]
MNRRSAMRRLAQGTAGVAVSSAWVDSLSALARQQAHTHAAQAAIAAQEWAPKVLSAPQNELVVTLTELIIPATDTPGAKAARVNRFVDFVLQQAPPEERKKFVTGLALIESRSKAVLKKDFLAAPPEEQVRLLTRFSAIDNPDKEPAAARDFFQALKSMTIDGYYTTEIGLRQELGDNGQLFLPQFQGCDHPEHQ